MEALVILVCLVGVTVVNTKSLDMPTYLTACAYDDPDLNACAVKSANRALPYFIKGDKKYRVPNLEPLEITSLQIDEGGLGLKLTTRNLKVYGLTHTHVDSAEFDLKRNYVLLNITIPRLEIEMDYEVSGKILILPITGSGPGNITITNLKASFNIEWDLLKKKDGKEYIDLKDGHLDFTVSRMYVRLENLFNGNKLLGDQINVFMDENWQSILKEFGPIVGEAISVTIKRIISNIFYFVSYDKVFPRAT